MLKKLIFFMIIIIGAFAILAYNIIYSVDYNYNESISNLNYKFEIIENNIKLIELTGSNYQKGYSHGLLLEEDIKFVIKELKKIINNEPFYKNIINNIILNRTLKNYMSYIPQKYLEEIKGISDAANVDFRDVLLLNVYDDIYNVFGCTNFANWDNDNLIHGRNLDYLYPELMWNNSIILYFKNEDYNDFISVTWPGLIGVLTGVNEKGLSLGSMTSKSPNQSKNRIPTGFLYRKILENAKNIKNTQIILNENKPSIGNNLLISSKNDGFAVVFEIDSNNIELLDNKNNYIAAANHFTVLENNDPPLNSSIYRLEAANRILRNDFFENNISNFIYLTRNSHIDRQIVNDLKIQTNVAAIANKYTVLSVIFENFNNKIYIAINDVVPSSHGRYFEFNIFQNDNISLSNIYSVDFMFLDSKNINYRSFLNKDNKNDYWDEEKIKHVIDLYDDLINSYSGNTIHHSRSIIRFLININQFEKAMNNIKQLELYLDENNLSKEIYWIWLEYLSYYEKLNDKQMIIYYVDKINNSDISPNWLKENALIIKKNILNN